MTDLDPRKIKLRELMADYMYESDVDDAFMVIDALLRDAYVDGYNSAAKQFGPTDVEVLKG